MKNLKILIPSLVIISALIISGCQGNGANNDIYGYTFKTAKLTYKVSGTTNGTSQVLVKGDKKVISNDLVQTSLDGSTKPIKTLTIQDGEKIYSLNPATKTGNSLNNPLYNQLMQMSPAERQTKLLDEALRTSDQDSAETIKSSGEKQIAGQTCQIYATKNGTLCLWENIPLESKVTLTQFGIDVTTVATQIDLNVNIDDQEFNPPKDYQINELK